MKCSPRRITAMLMLIALAIGFCSCASDEAYAMEYKGYKLSEGMYRYWMISWKENFVNNYSDIEDTDEYWNAMTSEDSEQTNAQYIRDNIETRIKYYLVAQSLFDEYGLSLSSDAKKKISGYIDDKLNYYGSRSACNDALEKKYGIDLKTLEKIYTWEEKYLSVYDYLYGTSGKLTATADEIDKYYKNYYARAKYVMFLKDCKKQYDKDGKLVTDKDGHAVYEDLTEEEKKQVKANAEEAFADVKAGKSFDGFSDTIDYYLDKYMNEHVTDIIKNYPNGFYITPDEYAVHTAAVTEAVFDMKEGEVRFVENESCYFVVKKYALIDGAYTSTVDSDQFSYLVSYANSEKFTNDFSAYTKEISVDLDITSKYSIPNL